MSKKGEIPLYFIAIVPSDPVRHDAQHWKEYFAKQYNSKVALRSPPHITMHMPFRLKDNRVDELAQALKGINFSRFEIDFSGYGCFAPRVIYMNVINNDTLQSLFDQVHSVMKKDFNILNADYKYRGFHPHLTIAFRDLKKAAFKDAWEEFQNKTYENTSPCTEFTLLKHNGKSWDEYMTFRSTSEPH